MTEQKDKIAIFKTKEEVLSSMGRGDVEISQKVLKNSDFTSANNKEILGFMAESGSDYKIIDVKAVKNNPQAFFNLAFGECICSASEKEQDEIQGAKENRKREEAPKPLSDEEVKEHYIKNYGYVGYITFLATGCPHWKNACWDYTKKSVETAISLETSKREEFIRRFAEREKIEEFIRRLKEKTLTEIFTKWEIDEDVIEWVFKQIDTIANEIFKEKQK